MKMTLKLLGLTCAALAAAVTPAAFAAEPTSGARIAGAIAHYDLLLRSERFASARPDVVIRVGEMPTSKPLRAATPAMPAASHSGSGTQSSSVNAITRPCADRQPRSRAAARPAP